MSVVHFSNLPNLGSGYVSLSLSLSLEHASQSPQRSTKGNKKTFGRNRLCERGKDRQADRGDRKQNGGAAATLQERRKQKERGGGEEGGRVISRIMSTRPRDVMSRALNTGALTPDDAGRRRTTQAAMSHFCHVVSHSLREVIGGVSRSAI